MMEDSGKISHVSKSAEQPFELESHKRKSIYDKKSEQYHRYFNLLDDLAKTNLDDAYSLFFPALNNFQQKMLTAETQDQIADAAAILQKALFDLIGRTNRKFIAFRQETNAIKLIANEETIRILNAIDIMHTDIFSRTTNLIQQMGDNILTGDSEALQKLSDEISDEGEKLKTVHSNLVSQMRQELNEI